MTFLTCFSLRKFCFIVFPTVEPMKHHKRLKNIPHRKERVFLLYSIVCPNRLLSLALFTYVVVVVITPPLPRSGATARTAVQVHAVNLIKIRLGERWQPILNQS